MIKLKFNLNTENVVIILATLIGIISFITLLVILLLCNLPASYLIGILGISVAIGGAIINAVEADIKYEGKE